MVLTIMLLLLAISMAINGVLFIVAFRRQTDKLTDISYALSFAALVATGLLITPFSSVKLLFAGMIAVWALRLGTYLLIRIRKIGRDTRFDAMRGSFVKFGRFWLSQAVSVWVISLAALLVLASDDPTFSWWSLFGGVIWLGGLCIEAIADQQKFTFINNPANKGMWIDSGLWHYSRHPNYLGEIMVWIGLYVAALPLLSGWEIAIGALSPLFITTLLLFISGIPPLEKSADKRWGNQPAYKAYKKRTSALLLLPPKHL